MAFKQSTLKAQIPIGCQFCEGETKIEWKCLDCSLLMCTRCKEKVHLKIKSASDHRIINIKDVGFCQESKEHFKLSDIKCQEHAGQVCCLFCQTCKQFICLKCLTKFHRGHEVLEEEEYNSEMIRQELSKLTVLSKPQVMKTDKANIKIKVDTKFVTDLSRIYSLVYCQDDSVWIADNRNTVQHIKIEQNKIDVISRFNMIVWDMAITSTNDILISDGGTLLKMMNAGTGQITHTIYDIAPLTTCRIHITRDDRVIIGAIPSGKIFPAKGKRVVIMMDLRGNHLTEFEYDKTNKPLFTYPYRITTTSHGNICVVDKLDETRRGRVIILGQSGQVVQIYTGHPDVNTEDRPFKPSDILTTPLDNVIVADSKNHALHILQSDGQIITYYRVNHIGIRGLYSLALSTPGHFYIGNYTSDGSQENKAKLYELKYSGF
ncbi:uncharacterized protein LOC127704890 [Mytilus californianus]|uniref:uncharacterized protein LOC127704890 n=1 Tax=Mytilus californianus TaxID=6549 RepID=UPI002247DA3C|nr:uncharacterized protein LOC127704890 [Mytilus californianus]